jgi:hypothetical protein
MFFLILTISLKEFKQYGLSDLTRNIKSFKIALATLLITGIWFPFSIYTTLMAFLMIATVFHF